MDNRFYLCVFTCLFNKDLSKILLFKKNREKEERYGSKWYNVGGKINFGEESIDAALRELREETGLILTKENAKFIFVKEDYRTFPNSHVGFFIYAARIEETLNILLNGELESYQWFDVNKLPENVIDDIPLILRLYKNKLCE